MRSSLKILMGLGAALSVAQLPVAQIKLSTPGRVQVPPAPPPSKVLEVSSTKLVAAPDFGAYGTPVCDDDGNAYYHVGSFASYSDSTVFRLAADEDDHQVFKLPPDAPEGAMFGAFNVTPAGRLWVVAFDRQGKIFGYRFSRDGTVAGRVHFEAPVYLQPELFAAFDNDFFLLQGSFAKAAGPQFAGKKFAGLFGPGGVHIRELQIKQLAATDAAKKRLPEGAISVGSDGNAYLLLPEKILVISQSGQVLRELPFRKREQEDRAGNLYVSGGLVVIALFRARHTEIETHLLALDANTGDEYGYYEPSPELGNNPICFSRDQGVTFMRRNKDGKVKLQTAMLR